MTIFSWLIYFVQINKINFAMTFFLSTPVAFLYNYPEWLMETLYLEKMFWKPGGSTRNSWIQGFDARQYATKKPNTHLII